MPMRPWEEFAPTSPAEAGRWRVEAPALPIAQLDRIWLAPHLEAWALAGGRSPIAEADALAHGRFRVFSHDLADIGFPPRWRQNVLTGHVLSAAGHWTEIPDDGAEDIKGVWECSRFAWAQILVRAWVLDGEARHVDLFWRLLEHWMRENPPNRGPHWMCGQEAALRLISVTFATQAFRHHPATTDARLLLAARLAEATARRIEAHIDYALSQGNNHGIAEAVGLLTAGTFWPGLRSAASRRSRGLAALTAQVIALVAEDGGFSQHSTNYHRLFLQLMSWAELTCRSSGHALPPSVSDRLGRATDFLSALMEPDGTVPRYGADDGADLFPLSGCDYGDFRPAVGVARLLFKGERLPAGRWDEAALLLLGPLAPSAAASCSLGSDFPVSGATVLRNRRGAAFFRAPTVFRHRPSQADHLHVSLRWDGTWLTEDPGTYSYNAPGGLDGLAAARHHNVVTVNGLDPMRRVGRFLWLPWPVCHRETLTRGVRAWHAGYAGYRCARSLLVFPQGFVVIDRITGAKPGECVLRWHGRSRDGLERLAVICSEPSAESWLTADDVAGEGWHSTHYGSRLPAYARCQTAVGRDVIFVTALGCEVRLEDGALIVDGEKVPL